ncbi:hypothetical protein QR680_001833 [Steinernema hermaphroditum]|uniref:Uncharacterized protein n=1 Tax=Steinernema hermaphroditum TaxID=289476 RepID=A0AA39H0X0_9BILA|nr:hypothetical protein QR680_001833 [Steinernema hermaphroditum]
MAITKLLGAVHKRAPQYSYASAGSSAGGSPSYGGRTYTSGYSEPYSSYYSSSSDSSGGRPYSSYSSYSSHCAYENDVVIENGISRPMTDRERQLVRNYEREIMNYNQRSAAAIFNMNLRFMEQIRDGQFPTLYPYEMNQMPQPPCLCSSCRRGYSSSSYHYEK